MHGELQCDVVAWLSVLRGRYLQNHFASMGELNGIPKQVHKNLPEAARVTTNRVGDRAVDFAREGEILLAGAVSQHRNHVVQVAAKIEIDIFEIQLAGVHLREIEN